MTDPQPPFAQPMPYAPPEKGRHTPMIILPLAGVGLIFLAGCFCMGAALAFELAGGSAVTLTKLQVLFGVLMLAFATISFILGVIAVIRSLILISKMF